MILTVENLRYAFENHTVLQDVSFSVREGEFISVLGPNGVGKSTMFRCILGILRNYEGSILVSGDEVRTLPQKELAHRIAYIPQIHRPAFSYTVLDMVLMGTAHQLSPFTQPGATQKLKADAALQKMGIEALADRVFTHLSGGEQQLVLIARALVQEADILIMDEPTSSLDFGNQLRTLQCVQSLTRSGYTVLLSTHNPQHALSFSDRILALSGGRVAALGTPETALTPTLIKTLYEVNAELVETAQGRVIMPNTQEVTL